VNYFIKTKQCPNPEQLMSYGFSVPKFDEALISGDLEQAADFRKAYPAGSFKMALEQTWEEAGEHYMQRGYREAMGIAAGVTPSGGSYKFEKRMKELFGENEADWNKAAFSQIWLAEYFAANPFVAREEEEPDPANEHEYVLATGVDASGDEIVNTTLTAINATDIKPEQLTWLWPERIPQGTICWFTGKPGLGKSLATLDTVARVTTGRDWPDGEKNDLPPQDVLLAISEDPLSTVVIPRLNAAGANLAHVKFFNRIKLDEGSRELQLSSDMTLLRRALEANPSVSLVVLDPLESFFGDVNININQEIRPITNPLKRICERAKVTLIGIVHDNKRSDVSAIQKIPGGSAVSAAARGALGFSRDPENGNEFFMSMVKGSFSKKQTGLKYTIGEKTVDGISAPHIVWGEEHDLSADDLLNAERDTGGRKDKKQIEIAREFLPGALSKGPRLARDLYAEAEKLGISSDTLKRAKNELGGVMVMKHTEGWMWSTGQDDPITPDDALG
jgi:hypothetical protein